MLLPRLDLRRTTRGEPVVILFGVRQTGSGLEAGPFLCLAPLRKGTRLRHEGIKYEMPKLERRFYWAAISLERVE